MFNKFHEECGLFGIYNHPEASNITYLGLHALQHRGQESCGIVSSDGKWLHAEISMGLVAEVFSEKNLKRLPGRMAIGHNRYSTTGSSVLKNAQPFVIDYSMGSLALAHNGNIINALEIRKELERYGTIFRSTMDSEVIAHLIALSNENRLVDRIADALTRIKGAYSLLLMSKDELIGVRDPYGFRPLSLGRLKDSYVLASETCAFDLIEAEFIRDIRQGEIVVINNNEIYSFKPFPPQRPAKCIFEFIYFSRPDSNIFGENVNIIRKRFGARLSQESPVDVDIVIPVPDSGLPTALGYSEHSGIPFEMGLIRSHYVGRTFIEPSDAIRHFGVKLKLNPVKKVIQGKRVIIVDDSIVRGTTIRKIVKMIRDADAKEIHIRIGSPPASHPCFYGIDTPNREELIASTHSVEDIRKYLMADSLAYLSLNGMMMACDSIEGGFCTACFNGKYPIEIPDMDTLQLRLFDK
ncbi:MAG: amidophosphoribosyltransferase [Nitrospinae bacterium]|nr:amidophosphoribosyltransferase [Nitrospinota bacterium]